MKLKAYAGLMATMGLALPSFAQQPGTWQLGAGFLHVVPQDSSEPLRLTAPVQRVSFGSGANLHSSSTLGLNLNYFIDRHWVVEGVFGIPPTFKLTGSGTLFRLGELGEARQWTPVLLGKWYFNEPTARLRPYVGLGVSYTRYDKVRLTQSLQGALGQQLGQSPFGSSTDASLKSSFAPAFNAGLAYQFDERWGMALSFTYIPLKTTATLTTRTLTGVPVGVSEARFKLNPFSTYVAGTYNFR